MSDQTLGSAVLVLRTDSEKFDSGMQQAKGFAEKTFDQIVAKAAGAFTLFAAGRFAVDQLKSSFAEFTAQEDAVANLEGTLRATNGVLGMTSKELQTMAGEFQRTTRFADEQVIAAEAVLVTFTKIGRDAFPRVLQLGADMATLFGGDLTAATRAVGIAVNNPAEAFGRLQKQGVSLSAELKSTIENLVATGRTAEAQGILLGELEGRFGGLAEAAGKTAAGAVAEFNNALSDLKEIAGGVIAQNLAPFLRDITDALRVKSLEEEISKLPRGLERATLEIQKQKTEIALLTDAIDKQGDLFGIRARRLKEMETELSNTIREQASYALTATAAARERAKAIEDAAKAAADEEQTQMHLGELDKAWLKTEENKTEMLQRQLAYFSSDVFDQHSAKVQAVVAMYQEMLDKSKDIVEVWSGGGMEAPPEVLGEMVKTAMKYNNELDKQADRWREIARLVDEANARQKQWRDLLEGVGEMVAQNLVDSFERMGEAIGKGADGAETMGAFFKNLGLSILQALPSLLLQAGLQMMTPMTWPIGVALLIAAGASALIAGIATGAAETAEEGAGSESTSAGSSRGGRSAVGGASVVQNVRGSVISERELGRFAMAEVGRRSRAY